MMYIIIKKKIIELKDANVKENPVNIWSRSCALCRFDNTQPAFTCSNLTTETIEQGVKYIQC